MTVGEIRILGLLAVAAKSDLTRARARAALRADYDSHPEPVPSIARDHVLLDRDRRAA